MRSLEGLKVGDVLIAEASHRPAQIVTVTRVTLTQVQCGGDAWMIKNGREVGAYSIYRRWLRHPEPGEVESIRTRAAALSRLQRLDWTWLETDALVRVLGVVEANASKVAAKSAPQDSP
jgi:hypothetical protein